MVKKTIILILMGVLLSLTVHGISESATPDSDKEKALREKLLNTVIEGLGLKRYFTSKKRRYI